MSNINIEEIHRQTKEAWRMNWHKVEIETIMEIFDYPRVKKMFNIIVKYLPLNGLILEAGCGIGPWLIKLNMLGYKIAGIDYQEECIQDIKNYNAALPAYAADVRNIPFRDNTFEAYLSFGVIEHFPEGPGDALREAHRVLNNNGRMIITVPHRNIFIVLKTPLLCLKRSPFLRRIFKKAPGTHYYQRYFKVSEFKNLIEENRFSVEEIIPVDHIFSLVEFSGFFRQKGSYDGENTLAVTLGSLLEKFLPWMSAGSILIVARKI